MLKLYFENGNYIIFENEKQLNKYLSNIDEYVCYQVVYCDEFGRELVQY